MSKPMIVNFMLESKDKALSDKDRVGMNFIFEWR